jgi:hypothetical protein
MKNAQHGQTLVIFTIVCAFILLGTIALVGNAQVLFVNADRADAAALLAAQAGASAIDQHELYNNRVVLSPGDAVRLCQQAGAQVPFVISVRCTVADNTVTATVVERVTMPIPLWSGAETVSATHTARPAYGGTTGGF